MSKSNEPLRSLSDEQVLNACKEYKRVLGKLSDEELSDPHNAVQVINARLMLQIAAERGLLEGAVE